MQHRVYHMSILKLVVLNASVARRDPKAKSMIRTGGEAEYEKTKMLLRRDTHDSEQSMGQEKHVEQKVN